MCRFMENSSMQCEWSAADRAPHADLGVAALRELGGRDLDDDRHHVEALREVDCRARRTERARAGRVGQGRELAGGRLAVRNDAEELLDVDEERLFTRPREHLD